MATKPVNFVKLHEEDINLNGDEFWLEVDNHHDDVWVFPVDEAKYGYAMYIKLNWDKEHFIVKKAILGNGRNFENVSGHKLPLMLHRNYYETKSAFINFVKEYLQLNLDTIKR